MLLGSVGTFVFYLVAPWAAKPFDDGPEFVRRYFCGHPLEYITSAMFFVGMGILWTKWRLLSSERRSLASVRGLAENGAWATGSAESAEVIASLKDWQTEARSRGLGLTLMSQRLYDVLHYVTNRQDRGLEDHLRYLADLASDRLLQSYSLIRTLTWAVPIMGFLGTVVGITMAIANVTPEQLDSSLPEVTAGLAVAFDTTAQALGMSMILVFGTFLIERGEQSILGDVEQFGIDHLVPSLAMSDAAATQPTGIPALTEWTSQMLAQQTEFWNRHLVSLQSGWADALTRQTDSLAEALSHETQATLQMHRDGVNLARDSYASSLQQNTQMFTEQMQHTILAFVERVDAWQGAMQATTISSAGQTEELHRLGRTLLRMAESEERLIHLQEQLNQNLQTLQVVETLEQTVNSLNAAVHVLTAKTALRVAA
jgi:biopolymer transport protein ExbB/TolQ